MEELLPSSPDAVLESRKELITSPIAEENPIFRTAHFLKPSTTSIDESLTKLSSNLLPPIPSSSFEPRTCGLSISFNGWRNPQLKWSDWVAKMVSLHQSTWKKAGVYEAILNSTYQIRRNNDLILGVAERWCSDTRSFIFPWGEATITLEDMVVISGYSTLGSPVFSRLESANLRRIEERLIQARKELIKTPARKPTQSEWRKKFMNSGSEIEHEAFLSLWLSRFVLPTTSSEVISTCVFPIAIQLSKGTRIALAPAVLASIYRDLSLLNSSLTIPETETSKTCQDLVAVQSPFQLVQVWIWERFIELRPKPNLIKCGETRLSRWDKVKCEVENVRMVLASATTKDRFIWRPYANTLKNWDFPKFYAENGMWVLVDSTLHDEWMSFVKCLRVSGLVGLDCVEKYMPHRVAMQFGYDQDLPGCVVESILSPEMAWSDYSRPLGQVGLYIPSRAFKGGVTTRYKDWWEKSMLSKSELSNGKKRKEGGDIRKSLTLLPKGKNWISRFETSLKETTKEGDTGASSSVLGFGPKTSSETSLMTAKRKKTDALPAEKSETIFRIKSEENALAAFSPCSSKIARKLSPGYVAAINNSSVPAGFPPKCKEVVAVDDSDSAEEDNLSIAELSNRRCRGGKAENLSPKGKNLISRFETSLKETTKEGDSGASSSVLGFGPKTSSETSLMTAKRIKNDALTAEKSEPIFRIKSEENANLSAFSPCSSKIARRLSPGYITAINNSTVPTGFPPKCKEVVAGNDSDSAEEDNLTIAELSNRRRRGGEAENLSGGLSFQLSSRRDGVEVEVEKQVGNGGGISSGQSAERGGLQNLEGQLLEKAQGGNAAATSEIEMTWLKLEANISWIEERLIEMRKRKKKN